MRTRLEDQAGAALAIVMALLLLVMLLAAAAASTAQRSNQDAARGVSAKRALAAADAGIQLGTQRLAAVPALGAAVCLTGSAAGAECPTATTVNLGNGASVSYYVSKELGTGVTCRSIPGYTAGTKERCITAIGTASGVKRRVQVRVTNASQSPPMFGTAGLIGRDFIEVHNSNEVDDPVGSNGLVTVNNSNTLSGSVLLGPGAPAPSAQSQSQMYGSPKIQYSGAPWDLPVAPVPEPIPPTSGNPYNNHNLSTTHYNAAPSRLPKRFFAMANAAYTIPAGTYNFCGLFLGSSSTISITGTVTIYIDSPARPGSDCGTRGPRGRVLMDNNVKVDDTSAADSAIPARLQIYVYGTRDEANNTPFPCPNSPDDLADVVLCNSVTLRGALYAPESTVSAANSFVGRGGIAAKGLFLRNASRFTLTNSARAVPGFGAASGAARRAWVECQKAPITADDPESGC